MILNKINEGVEYYVFDNNSNRNAFTFVDDKVTEIQLPKNIKALKEEYIFIYVGDLRAHPNNDYTIEDCAVKFKSPMNAEKPIVVKIYTKHEVIKDVVSDTLSGM